MSKEQPERLVFPTAESADFGAYHDLYSSGTTVSRHGSQFTASVAAFRFPSLLLFNRVVAGASHHRDRSRLQRDGFDHFNLQVLRSGKMAAGTPGNEQAMGAGDVVIFDTSKPQRTIVSGADYVSIAILRRAINAAIPDAERLHGCVLPVATAGLLSDFILSLGLRAPRLGIDIAASSATFVGKMLAEVASTTTTVDRDADEGTEDALMQRWRAEAYINAHLPNRLLDPELVAKAIGVSRSGLYRLFKPTGGVAAFILERRIARLRSLLLNPHENRSIAELAHLLGFAQESHCSRAFKALCGTSPGQLREAAREMRLTQKVASTSQGWADWWNDVT